MNTLSQLDIATPDHISVITKEGRVTISVMKDGTSVTLAFPIRTPVLDSTPRPPLQQSVPLMVKTEDQGRVKPVGAPGSTHLRYRGPIPKLNAAKVRDIKAMLKDAKLRAKYASKTKFYQAIGHCFDVTGCAIGNIDRGIAWTHIKA